MCCEQIDSSTGITSTSCIWVQLTLITFSRVFSTWQPHYNRTSTEFLWLETATFSLHSSVSICFEADNKTLSVTLCFVSRSSDIQTHTYTEQYKSQVHSYERTYLQCLRTERTVCSDFQTPQNPSIVPPLPPQTPPLSTTVQFVSYPSKPVSLPPAAAHTISLYQYCSVSGITTACNLSLCISLIVIQAVNSNWNFMP